MAEKLQSPDGGMTWLTPAQMSARGLSGSSSQSPGTYNPADNTLYDIPVYKDGQVQMVDKRNLAPYTNVGWKLEPPPAPAQSSVGIQGNIQTFADGSQLNVATGQIVRGATGSTPTPATTSPTAGVTSYAYGTTPPPVGTQQTTPAFGTQTSPGSLPPEWQALLDQNKQILDSFIASGQRLNPSVEITPETTQRFLDQAKTQLAPYYKQVFSNFQQDIQRGMQRLTEGLASKERDLGTQYGQALESRQTSFGRRGLEFSSERQRSESDLANQARQAIAEARTSTKQAVENLGTQGERQIGSAMFPTNLPTPNAAPTPQIGLPGRYGFDFSTQTGSPLFSPVGGQLGETEREQTTAEQNLKNQLMLERQRLSPNMLAG